MNLLNGQILGQDKDGFSTIIEPSSTFNLDLTNNVATLNYYQELILKDYPSRGDYLSEEMCLITSKTLEEFKEKLRLSWQKQESIYKRKAFMYGVDLKGGSSDGVAILFSNEQVLTSSSISGLIGLRWNKRVYNYKVFEKFAELTYGVADEISTENNLITEIEKELAALLNQKLITEEKQAELLSFRNVKPEEDKIERVESTINSIIARRGLTEPAHIQKTLESRFEILKIMESQVATIKADIETYLTKVRIGEEQDIYIAVDKLISSIKDFENNLSNSSIKPLKLKLDYDNYKDAATWASVMTKISNVRENTGYELYKSKSESIATFSLNPVLKAYKEYERFLKEEKISFDDIQIAKGNTYSIQRNLLYFKGGFLGTSFKYDLANEGTTINERFTTKNFQGYRLELGYTAQLKRYNFLGINLAMSRTSNATLLKSTTYKFEETDTSVIPNITTSNEIKALSGEFDRFLRYEINFDYVLMIPFHNSNTTENDAKNSKLLLSLNPFIRHNFYDGSETLKPNTSLGLGLYSFNKTSGSIAGGIFIQADDVFNVNSETTLNFTKQISFGVVFKLAIKSFDPEAR